MDNISEMVQKIALTSENDEKMKLFQDVRTSAIADINDLKKLIPLLYEEDSNIRLETAYFLDARGVKPKADDYLQFRFALQDFEFLFNGLADNETARRMLFDGFKDKNLRIRAKILRCIHEKDCRTMQEKILYYYGRTDYETIANLYFDGSQSDRQFIMDLLRYGVDKRKNPPYHRRQCALLLEKLIGAEKLDQSIRDMLKSKPKSKHDAPLNITAEIPKPMNKLDIFIDKLQENGIRINGRLRFPEIRIGEATGRIIYRNPGLQTWPKTKRRQEITPPEGMVFLRYDFKAIEPTILLNILLKRHLFSLADVPEGDIYYAVYKDDRNKAKRYLNSLINGGSLVPEFMPGNFLWKLIPALDELRNELYDTYEHEEGIYTIGGRKIGVPIDASNFRGKLTNRLIQGSAADYFNNAVLQIDDWIEKNRIDAAVGFLIYDEVWVSVNKRTSPDADKSISAILNNVYRDFDFILPISVDKTD